MRIRSACLGAVAFWIAPMTAWALCKGTPPTCNQSQTLVWAKQQHIRRGYPG
jgi:hypothetical protein